MAEITINKENFENEVIKSEIPVLIDFWATWCGPCKMLAPIIEEIANKYEGQVKVGKVNIDEEPAIADAFRIESIPTLVVIKEGKIVNSAVGYMPMQQVEELLK